MKSFIYLLTALSVLSTAHAAPQKAVAKAQKAVAKAKAQSNTSVTEKPGSSVMNSQLKRALEMAQGGEVQGAAAALFTLGKRSELTKERAQIKYILGLMLMEMGLNQTAAFQFVDVIRQGDPKYTKLAVEKLSVVADGLGDDTLLNYALNKMDFSEVPTARQDMINFRIGEIKLKNREFTAAEENFGKVKPGSSHYSQAIYNLGLAQLEQKKIDESIKTFQRLLEIRSAAGVTDTNRVAAQLSIARALYQKQDWDQAVIEYSKIPRDHFLWHQAIFEQSWAMLRGARFRSALSNFQSLHSAYYEDFYIPESLLLRSIVYLYICKYDEMEKVLGLFEKTYGPVSGKIKDFVQKADQTAYFNEAEKAWTYRKGRDMTSSMRVPYLVMRNVLNDGEVRRGFQYLKALEEEKESVERNYAFKNSPLGGYALKVIQGRMKNTKLAIADLVKANLLNMRAELKDLYEQAGFIRYEMINGKKEVLKKKVAGTFESETQIDEKRDREFYIQNGYEYYPFRGEFWLDEIGNYHYLGKSSCE